MKYRENMMLIDTHSHLNFNAYKNDSDEVIKRTLDENIWMINVGSNYETSKRAVEIAQKYGKGVFASIGLHPIHLTTDLVKIKSDPEEGGFVLGGESFDKEKYRQLAKSKKVVAIGEAGLDYYYKPKTNAKLKLFKQKQKQALEEQIELAKELGFPIIIHCRTAHDDLIDVLKFQVSGFRFQGVIHCFTGNWEQARKYLEMGFYLGFNGIIFKFDVDEVIKKTPLEKVLIETDCPYLTPPSAGEGRNEPIFIKYIAKKIAEIKNIDYEKVAEITTFNAKNLFRFQ